MYNQEEKNYLNLLQTIIDTGSVRQDRTGVGTKSIFGSQLRFSLENNTLPLLTTKKTFFRGIVEELLWFIRGETNSKSLESRGVNIWKGNSSREFLDKRGLSHYAEGEIGPMYGFQWRNFGSMRPDGAHGIDQLQNCFNLIKTDPYSRRIMVTAYNPTVSHMCALDPCHLFYQFYVDKGKLSCNFHMRSVDYFLGLPFNVASYAVLTLMMAKATGLQGGELVFTGGDSHVYLNHEAQVLEQISREPYPFPTLKIHKNISSIKDMERMQFEDFELVNYQSHPAIKADMAI